MAEETTSRLTKNNVFIDFFSDEKNVYQLYGELHPEDTDVKPEDISMVTLQSIIVNTLYNDLGFRVKDRYIILVEAQSNWSANMSLRMLFYLTQTYRHYLKETKQSELSARRVKLPKPDLYVVYSGQSDVPDEISLSEDFFDGNSPVDVRVKVLHTIDKTLCGQYVGFCRVFDEQRKIYRNGIDCAKATIRICIGQGYLSEYLKVREKETITMLAQLFDEVYLREQYKISEFEAGKAEGIAEGKAEGKAEGIAEKALDIASNLLRSGLLSKEHIASMTGLPLETINELAAQGV